MNLTLLEDRRRDHGSLGLSVVLHIGAVILILLLPLIIPGSIAFHQQHYSVITLVAPRREPPPAPVAIKLPKPKPIPVKFDAAQLVTPAPKRAAEIHAPKVAFAEPKVPKLFPVAQNSLPRLVPAVKTGVLTGSSAPATIKAPARQVQTGGFGDPNGAPPAHSPSAGSGKLVMAKLGSFDLPPGPGYGNGTGGASGMRGTIKSAGFGNSVAGRGEGGGQGGSPRGGVRAAGFGDASVAEAKQPRATAPAEGRLEPVEILAKPNPLYTAEARDLKIEGEVLLEVVFAASGELRVLRVVRGLGHGLDEAAARSAQQIRFKPARRAGQPVDSTATLHVRFQLAY